MLSTIESATNDMLPWVSVTPFRLAGRTGRVDDGGEVGTHHRFEPGYAGEDADAAAVAAALSEISKRIRIRLDWDEAQLATTFRRVESLGGKLAVRLVRRGAVPVGWYAFISRPVGASRLLHLAADERAVGAVFADLVGAAGAAGSAVLTGRAEPHLERPLRGRIAAVGFAWQPVIRARDPRIDAALATGISLLTRLDGELSRVH
jgi:hypothetical protein